MTSRSPTAFSWKENDSYTRLNSLVKAWISVEALALMFESKINVTGGSSRIRGWAGILSTTATELQSEAELATEALLTEAGDDTVLAQTAQNSLEAHQKSIRKGLSALDKEFKLVADNATPFYDLVMGELEVLEVYLTQCASEKVASGSSVEISLTAEQIQAIRDGLLTELQT